MGRRGGGGFGGGSRSSPAPKSSGGSLWGRSKPAAKPAPAAQPTRRPPPPAPAAPAAAPAPAQGGGGGMLSGLAGTMMSGMAFGTGSAVAHRAVDSVMGPRETVVRHEGGEAAVDNQMATASSSGVCGDENSQFQKCLKENPGDFANCRFYFDILNQCQDNAKFQ
eukprot:CAMPEP_0175102018 /NCGR_PEP_ID=MMETSP0086_2-20121207/8174_1 /TAXON_ID=136419 /ORGANISM="Unknown Unknown, Strain D1" /LENGTH=164 /DNA_ID=CAMNT_0016376723 /DNA_START=98 /DNA_END=592 /DNA_ORIENTATION=+